MVKYSIHFPIFYENLDSFLCTIIRYFILHKQLCHLFSEHDIEVLFPHICELRYLNHDSQSSAVLWVYLFHSKGVLLILMFLAQRYCSQVHICLEIYHLHQLIHQDSLLLHKLIFLPLLYLEYLQFIATFLRFFLEIIREIWVLLSPDVMYHDTTWVMQELINCWEKVSAVLAARIFHITHHKYLSDYIQHLEHHLWP